MATRHIKAEWLVIDAADEFLWRRLGMQHPPLAECLGHFPRLEAGPLEKVIGRMIEKLTGERKSRRTRPAGAEDERGGRRLWSSSGWHSFRVARGADGRTGREGRISVGPALHDPCNSV